jgi:AbrB family looped-hinge helix DNA binding protein
MNSNFLTYYMEIAKISSKGQVVIPKELRNLAGLKEGDAVLFRITDNIITIEKVDKEVGSMVKLLKKGSPFQKNLVKTLREEWE